MFLCERPRFGVVRTFESFHVHPAHQNRASTTGASASNDANEPTATGILRLGSLNDVFLTPIQNAIAIVLPTKEHLDSQQDKPILPSILM